MRSPSAAPGSQVPAPEATERAEPSRPNWLPVGIVGGALVVAAALCLGALLLAPRLGITLPFALGRGPSVEYVMDASLRMADTGSPSRLEVAVRGLEFNLRQQALEEAFATLSSDAQVAVLRGAGEMLPILGKEEALSP